MTTNKPEVLGYLIRVSGQNILLDHTNNPEGLEKLIRLSDYESLQAECEKLDEELAETELRALKFIHQCGAHVELYRELIDERDAIQAECEKLRKGAGGLVEALKSCRDELTWMIERHNQQDQNDGSWLYDYQTVVEADTVLATHHKGGDQL